MLEKEKRKPTRISRISPLSDTIKYEPRWHLSINRTEAHEILFCVLFYTMQSYHVQQYRIYQILSDIQKWEIVIPEIQRPFVWDSTKVRNLMDSLYRWYPIGYIVAWKNPNVRLKDGTISQWKSVLIDWQQRITALRAAILWEQIVDKDYRKKRIIIAFNPLEERFETMTPAIEKDIKWIKDISLILSNQSINLFSIIDEYCLLNPDIERTMIQARIQKLLEIQQTEIWYILLDSDLDIETVTDIFIRINSAWVVLDQADFAMSKIASSGDFGVNLRKCIDYFCHLAREPKFFDQIREVDVEFRSTEYFQKISWLKDETDDLYNPDYSDILRVAFTKEFGRWKMSELVSLLSWRNFETRTNEQEIIEKSFAILQKWILSFVNETNFKRFIMILRSAGFIDSSMISSQNVINFAYILYLKLRDLGEDPHSIEKYVKKWFVLSILTWRYSGSPESKFDFDIKRITADWIKNHLESVEVSELSSGFWEFGLVKELDKAIISSPYLNVFWASQIFFGDKGFLSKDISVWNMIAHRGDIHHLFPKEYLRQKYDSRWDYNQIANFVYLQQEINIKIGKKAPNNYFSEILSQCNDGEVKYWWITDMCTLSMNLEQNCIPESIFEMTLDNYPQFLEERRKLMAQKIEKYYKAL